MELLYWIGEYAKVFAAYMIIMYAWPNVVFRKYLRGKSSAFRFSFCVTTQIVLLSTVVLMLGLTKLLYPWVFRGIFWGIPALSLLKDLRITEKQKRFFKYIVTGTMGTKNLIYRTRKGIQGGIHRIFQLFFEKIKGNVWECLMLSLIVIYGMIYFDYGAFVDRSFGTGDLYPHAAWVYGLIQGQPFSAGIYPEGMHCVIYSIHVLMGVKLYSVMLFLQSVHVHVFLISVYLLLREVFQWKYTAMMVLTGFLVLDASCNNMVVCYARLQWTIPQEFATHTPFLCAAYLIRYLKAQPVQKKEKPDAKKLRAVRQKHKLRAKLGDFFKKKPLAWFYGDENLFVFSMSFAASVIVHFYPAIMAFFFCLGFVVFLLYRLFARGKLKPLIGAVFISLFFSVLPMGVAFAEGIPFQGSIGWALSVMGLEKKEDEASKTKEPTQNSGASDTKESSAESSEEKKQGKALPPVSAYEGGSAKAEVLAPVRLQSQASQRILTGAEQIRQKVSDLKNKLPQIGKDVYEKCYLNVFQEQRANIVLYAAAAGMLVWLIYRLITALLYLIRPMRRVLQPTCYDLYPGLILVAQIFMIMASPKTVGMPVLIDTSRLCVLEQILELGTVFLLPDLIFSIFLQFLPKVLLRALGTVGIAGVVLFTQVTDTYHGYLYYTLTRYNSAVMVTNRITEELPEWSYTIVSTTDELYQQIEYGWHEEQVHFINMSADKDYKLPTQYIFIYLEKKAIKRNQHHVFTGPEWLARSKYFKELGSEEIIKLEYDDSYVLVPGFFLSEASGSYANTTSRRMIQATTREWLDTFEERYPNELKLFFEDDDFVCYYFKQNVNRLYQLGIREEEEKTDVSAIDQ